MIEILFYYIKTSLIVIYFVLSVRIILHIIIQYCIKRQMKTLFT